MLATSSAPLLGITWFIGVHLISSHLNVIARLLSESFHPTQLVVFYHLGALPWVLWWNRSCGKKILHTTQHKLHLIRAVLECAGFILTLTALTLLPLPVHGALILVTPIVAVFMATFLLKEHLTRYTILALGGGLVGAMLLAIPGGQDLAQTELLGIGLMLGASLCFGTCACLIRKLASHDAPSVIVFYMVCFTGLFAIPFAVPFWRWPSGDYWAIIFVLGLMVYALQFAVTKALSYATVGTLAPFMFVSPLAASLLGWLVFDETLDLSTAIGALVIFLSAVYAVRHALQPGTTHP